MPIALACALLAAKEHIVDFTCGADGSFRHLTSVAPGKFIEVCSRLAPGQTVAWDFEAAAPMDFRIHRCAGDLGATIAGTNGREY